MLENIVVRKVLFFIDLKKGNIFFAWAGVLIYFVACIYWVRVLTMKYVMTKYEFIYLLLIIISIIHIIDCVLFIVGLVKSNEYLILPWLFGEVLLTIIYLVSYGILYPSVLFWSLAFNWLIIKSHIWICGFSFYYKMVIEPSEQTPLLADN